MKLEDKTTDIQHELLRRKPGSLPKWGADGDYGNEMADALLKELAIAPKPAGGDTGLVTGKAKNIKRIFIHCSATREGQDIDAATIRKWHKNQGWRDIGYHFVIKLDGTVEPGRPEHITGSHARGYNTGSVAMVYVGGLDSAGKPKDTRTPEQLKAMAGLTQELLNAYPGSDLLGHRDISPDKDGDGKIEPHEFIKACPCFDVKTWWSGI